MDLARAIALFQSDDEGDVNGALLKRAAATGGSRLPLDQPAFNRNRLKAEKLIDSKVLEQLIRVQADAGCSTGFSPGRSGNSNRGSEDCRDR